MKDKIFKEIIDCYTMSNESKGLLFKNIKNFKEIEDIIELVKEGKIQVLHIEDTMNPFVKNYNVNKTTEAQIEDLKKNPNECIIYPSEKILIELRPDKGFPYSILSKNSNVGRNDLIFFKQEALKKYIDDENYKVQNSGFNYNIITLDEAVDKGVEFIEIKHCAPSKNFNSKERALGITLNELNKLPSKEQMYWNTFELDNQKEWIVNEGFKKTHLIGEWLDEVWFYDDILEKISLINKLCLNLDHPPLFRKEFNESTPVEFSPILIPTTKEFNSFLVIFNNMICENINEKFFSKNTLLKKPPSLEREDGSKKGSIQMLEDFLNAVYPHETKMIEDIISPMYKLRKMRNPSAHKVQESKTDLDYYDKQEDIVYLIWKSVCNLSNAIGNHPNNLSLYFSKKMYPATFY